MNESKIMVDSGNEATIKIRLIPQVITGDISNKATIKINLVQNEIKGRVAIPVRVQGLQGEVGPNSVYVGESAPEDDIYDVWVNPSGLSMRYVSSINNKTGEVYLDPDDYGVESLTNQEIEDLLKF